MNRRRIVRDRADFLHALASLMNEHGADAADVLDALYDGMTEARDAAASADELSGNALANVDQARALLASAADVVAFADRMRLELTSFDTLGGLGVHADGIAFDTK